MWNCLTDGQSRSYKVGLGQILLLNSPRLQTISLSHSYAVFGLGSTAYEHFCAYGKRLDMLLQDLGGTRQELVH